jgi:hypothetical protein
VAARHADATPSLDRAMEFAVAPGGRAYTFTVRDGKRFAGPLALPRSCPLTCIAAVTASGSAMVRLPFWGVLHCTPLP